MGTKYTQSPINYMGNKHRLINKGLIDLFPKDIDTFYDLFAGSGVVSMSVDASKYVLNDLDSNVFKIYEFFKETKDTVGDINTNILSVIEDYGLPLFSTDSRRKGITKEVREKYKSNYMELREDYNTSKNIYKLLTLQYYAMSRTMRFNNKGEFNMPFGNGYYIEDKYVDNIAEMLDLFKKDVAIKNLSYDKFKDVVNEGDFVYLDPPYIGTTATYSENNQWTEDEDEELFKFCLYLDSKGIKFALSNTYWNKGRENTRLKEFVKDNNFKENFFDDFSYTSFGKGNSKTLEVLITNY